MLGAILLSERALYSLVIEEGLRPDDSTVARHQLIDGAMLARYGQSEPIDVLGRSPSTCARRARSRTPAGQSAVDGLAAVGPGSRQRRALRAHSPRALAACGG